MDISNGTSAAYVCLQYVGTARTNVMTVLTACGSFIPIKSTDKSHSIHLHRDLTQLAIFQCIEEVPECTHTMHTYTIMVLGCGETCFHQLPINGGRKALFSLPQGVTEVAKRP